MKAFDLAAILTMYVFAIFIYLILDVCYRFECWKHREKYSL